MHVARIAALHVSRSAARAPTLTYALRRTRPPAHTLIDGLTNAFIRGLPQAPTPALIQWPHLILTAVLNTLQHLLQLGHLYRLCQAVVNVQLFTALQDPWVIGGTVQKNYRQILC